MPRLSPVNASWWPQDLAMHIKFSKFTFVQFILTSSGTYRRSHHRMSMSMSMPGRRVAGPFWAQAVNQKKNYIYKSVFKNRCTLGHAEVVEGIRKRQPCFFDHRIKQFDTRVQGNMFVTKNQFVHIKGV